MNNFGEQVKLDRTEDVVTRRHVGYTKEKWVDDLTEVNSLDLTRYTVKLPDKKIIRPTAWYART